MCGQPRDDHYDKSKSGNQHDRMHGDSQLATRIWDLFDRGLEIWKHRPLGTLIGWLQTGDILKLI
jgi:hypothetical protein